MKGFSSSGWITSISGSKRARPVFIGLRLLLVMSMCLWSMGPAIAAAADEVAPVEQSVQNQTADQPAVTETVPPPPVETSPLVTTETQQTNETTTVSDTTTSETTSPIAPPIITTESQKYFPGDTVYISGSGFAAGETVRIVITNAADAVASDMTVTADTAGNVYTVFLVPPYTPDSVIYTVTATGLASGAVAIYKFFDDPTPATFSYDVRGINSADSKWTTGNLSNYQEGKWVQFMVVITNSGDSPGNPPESGLWISYDHYNSTINAMGYDDIGDFKYDICTGIKNAPDVNAIPVDTGDPLVTPLTPPVYPTAEGGTAQLTEESPLSKLAAYFSPGSLPSLAKDETLVIQFKLHLAITAYWQSKPIYPGQTTPARGASVYPGSSCQARLYGAGAQTLPGPQSITLYDLSLSGKKTTTPSGSEANWEIKLDGETSVGGDHWPVHLTTTTGTGGAYSFTNLVPGTYTVTETLRSGWEQTYPAPPGTHTYILVAGGNSITNADFANKLIQTTGSISGYKWQDDDADGNWDYTDSNTNGKWDVGEPGEPGLSGWEISATGLSSGSATTGSDGSYSIGNLLAGSYTVTETQQAGWTPTSPTGGSYTNVSLAGGENKTGYNFGNFQNKPQIYVTPDDVFNQQGTDHVFTVHLEKDIGHGWVSAGADHLITLNYTGGVGSITSTNPADGETDADGHLLVTAHSDICGTARLTASFDGEIDEASYDVTSPEGQADKTWIDYDMTVVTDDTNVVGEPHTFTLTLTKKTDEATGYQPAAGKTVDVSLTGLSTAGYLTSITNGTDPGVILTPTTGYGTTNGAGQLFVTINSLTPGTAYLLADYGYVLYLAQTTYHADDTGTKNWNYGSISGVKFNDLDGDGIRDFVDTDLDGVHDGTEAYTDPGLAGWTIYLDTIDNNTFDEGSELHAHTDGNGAYTIGNVPAGTYEVREVGQNGWTQTYPTPDNHYHMTVATAGNQQNPTGKDFGNFENIVISGHKFNDLNGNGVWNAGEPPIEDLQVTATGLTFPDFVSDTTEADGSYELILGPDFAGGPVPDQPWVLVEESHIAGWTQTKPNPSWPVSGRYMISQLRSGDVFENYDFGNFKNFFKTFALTVNEPIDGATYYVDYVSSRGNGTLPLVRSTGNTYTADTSAFTGPVTISSWTWRIMYDNDPLDLVPAALVWSKTITPQNPEQLTSHQDNTYTMSYSLVLTPETAANQENEPHDFTATVKDNESTPLANLPVYFSTNPAVSVTPASPQTTNGSGEITFSVNSATPASTTIRAWVNEEDGLLPTGFEILDQWGEKTDTSTKTWIDYNIDIDPHNATNIVGEDHTFTVTLTKNLGLGGGYVPAGDEEVSLTLDPVGPSYIQSVGSVTYGLGTTSATGTTDSTTGTLQVVIRATSDGTSTLIATCDYNAVDSGTVTTTTDPDNNGVKNWRDGSISGVKFEDTNGDGIKNETGTGRSGWTIWADFDHDGIQDTGETKVTSPNGSYVFEEVAAGTYEVREVGQDGWTQTYPTPDNHYHVTIATGSQNATNIDFGNFKNFTKTFALTVPKPINGVSYFVTYDDDGELVNDCDGVYLLKREGTTNTYTRTIEFTEPVDLTWQWSAETTLTSLPVFTSDVYGREALNTDATNAATLTYTLTLDPEAVINQVGQAHDFTATALARLTPDQSSGYQPEMEQPLTNVPLNLTVGPPGALVIPPTPVPPYSTGALGTFTFRVNSLVAGTSLISVWIEGAATANDIFDINEVGTGGSKTWYAGTIIGIVWYDINANQAIDTGEERLSGWAVTLYAADGMTVLGTQLSGPDGGYRFDNLPAGFYWVAESLEGHPEWSPTTPPIKRQVELIDDPVLHDIITVKEDFGNEKPFLPYTPELPYTGGLYYQAPQPMTVHAEGNNPPRQGNDGLLGAILLALLGLAMIVTGRVKSGYRPSSR